jgi:hypothetical protein
MASRLSNPLEETRFVRELTETIAWCTHAGTVQNAKRSLRTFTPEHRDLSSRREQVSSVSLQRTSALRSRGQRNLPPVRGLGGGRLLAYFPDDNLADGVAEAESGGFLDVNNIPPYDTWVWMVRNIRSFNYSDGAEGEMEADYLVAWVPPIFVELANRGIDVNPEGCILWVSDLGDDAFVQSLQRLQLVP